MVNNDARKNTHIDARDFQSESLFSGPQINIMHRITPVMMHGRQIVKHTSVSAFIFTSPDTSTNAVEEHCIDAFQRTPVHRTRREWARPVSSSEFPVEPEKDPYHRTDSLCRHGYTHSIGLIL